jgi:hypothetical protein
MAPYLAVTSTPEAALDLYRWNARMAGAMHEALGIAEVMLRNAIDRELQTWNAGKPPAHGTVYTTDWAANPAQPLWGILNPRRSGGAARHSTFATAFARAEKDRDLRTTSHVRHGAPITHDDVVAHITFGTWNVLLPRATRGGGLGPPAQRVLWEQALHRSFPHQQTPGPVKYWVERLHHLRNRVAHLEPLVDVDVLGYHRTIARLLSAIDPVVSDWYTGSSSVPAVFKTKP